MGRMGLMGSEDDDEDDYEGQWRLWISSATEACQPRRGQAYFWPFCGLPNRSTQRDESGIVSQSEVLRFF